VNRLVASHTAALKKARADKAPRAVVIMPEGLHQAPSQPAR